MNKILILTKVFLKSSFKFNYNKTENVNKSRKLLTSAGILILFLYIIGVFGFLSYSLINILVEANQETLFLGIFMLAVAMLILIQTIFSSINIFYFSKDIVNVLPLPIKPVHLIISKFNVLLISEYVVEFVFMLAPFVIYGYLINAGPLFYLYSVLVLLIFPILPAIIATIVIMTIMSFSKLTKYKDRFQLFTGILGIGLAVGIQFVVARMNEPSNEQILENLLQANGMVNLISKYFITIKPAVETLTQSGNLLGLVAFGKLLGITLISFIVFILIASRIYLKGVIGNSTSANSKIKVAKIEKKYKQNDVGISYFLKEIKMLFRNPIFFMQCILPSFLMPVVLGLSFFLNSGEMLSQIPQEMSIDIYNTIPICVILGIITFFFSMNFIAITAVSRDGGNAIFMKYIPVNLYKQAMYKILPSIIINIIPTLFTLVILKIVLKDASIIFLSLIFITALLINFMQSILMIIIDLKRPKLSWSSEYAVVKQNMNMMYGFILTFVLIGILAGLAFLLRDINYLVVFGGLILLFGIMCIIANTYFYKKQDKLFEKIM